MADLLAVTLSGAGLAWFASGASSWGVAVLRFQITVAQKRGLLVLALIVAASVLGLAVLHGLWAAAGLGVALLLATWACIMYACAFTECSAAGIRTRGLGWVRQRPWPQVADIAIRRGPGSRLVVVTTVDGTRFWLGAPVDGGVMPDPEFAAKFRQIVSYWQTAAWDQSQPGAAL
jgi:hypothetical protein